MNFAASFLSFIIRCAAKHFCTAAGGVQIPTKENLELEIIKATREGEDGEEGSKLKVVEIFQWGPGRAGPAHKEVVEIT